MTHSDRGRQLTIYLCAVFAWTWGIAALLVAFPDRIEAIFGEMHAAHPLFVAAVYAPSLLSLVLTAVFEGREGLGRLLRRLDPRRASPWWFLAVPVGMVLIAFASGGVGAALGRGSAPAFAGWSAVFSALTVMFLLEPGPIGEELGWRGFVLPRMLERWSPRAAGLILGVIWAVWHLPAFFIGGTPQTRLSLPIFLLGAVALSVLFTALFVRTAGSVLLAILLHRMANSANDLVEIPFEPYALGIGIVAVLLLAFGGLERRPPEETLADG